MIKNTYLTAAILSSFLILSGWLHYFGQSNHAPRILDPKTLNHSVDLMMFHVAFDEFDEQGKMIKHLEADKVTHIPFKNQFILYEPHITFHNETNEPWHLSAKKATTTDGLNHIVFRKKVILNQKTSAKAPETTMYTDSLTYLPKQAEAFTKSPVLFKQQNNLLHSEGMQANLNTNKIKLTHAHAKIQPNKVS